MTFFLLTIITGIIYPLLVTGIARGFFHEKADGSLIYRSGTPVGSTLIGQPFDDPRYFRGRPSATSPVPYNAASSSGSNFGPLNPSFFVAVNSRISTIKSGDPNNKNPIPVDIITSSASGLDPHISLAGAYYQIPRVAHLRRLSEDTVRTVVQQHTSDRFLGLIGEPVVPVLELNLALDDLMKKE